MYELAKKARSGMKSKAERLAGEKDRKTDSSDWSPAEPLNADVKTGMRPVSRRAYKDGGKVAGCAPKGRADRKPRKAGGKVEAKGEQPLVDRYVNRDLKKANEYRDGKKHIGGLKTGGRAGKLSGGALERYTDAAYDDIKDTEGAMRGRFNRKDPRDRDAIRKGEDRIAKRERGIGIAEDKLRRLNPETYKSGGRAKKADGGPADLPIKKGSTPKDFWTYQSGSETPSSPPAGSKMSKSEWESLSPGMRREIHRSFLKLPTKANGGRAAKANGGSMTMEEMIKKNPAPAKKPLGLDKVPLPPRRPENLTPAANNKIKPDQTKYMTGDDITGPPKEVRKDGGRMKRADGGSTKKSAWKMTAAEMLESARKRDEDVKKGVEESKKKYPGMSAIERAEQSIKDKFTPAYFANLKKEKEQEKDRDEGYKEFADRRANKNMGGPMMQDPRLGIVKPKAMEFGQNVVTPGLKRGGRAEKASGGSAEFKAAFRAARNAFLSGEGPKNFEFKGKSYSTDLYKPTTGPATRGGTSGAPRQPVREKIIDVQFGAPKGEMPKTDQLGMPNQGMKKGGRIAKQIGGALGMSADRMMPQLPPQAMANAQGVPMQGGAMMPPGMANRPPMPMARADGGRTKSKGKTNINIVIATGKQQQPQSMVPDVNAAPMGPQGVPLPAPAPTAPMGTPPVPAAPMMGGPAPSGPMTPPSPMMPPMPRKAGGRVSKVAKSFKDMTAGAGSGEGRLQKTDIAKRSPRKAGGKVYRSYKDMDAGAGSGKGRLEKTEIQTHKK